MTTDTEVPPPAYPAAETQPPAYPDGQTSHGFVADEKARLAGFNLPLTVRTTAVDPSTSLASHATSLQPWSKVPYPTGSLIPEASWKAFISELRAAVSPASGQKALAVLAGLGVWIGTGWAPLGGLTGALIWKKATEKRVAQDLAGMQLEVAFTDTRSMKKVVDHYNTLWQGLGVRVRLDAVDKHAAHFCQCADQVEQQQQQMQQRRQRGCCGNGGGCGGRRKCGTCGKRRGGGKMREEVRRPIVQITLERIPRGGDVVRSTPSTPGVMTPASEGTVADDRFTMDEKEKWVEVTDSK